MQLWRLRLPRIEACTHRVSQLRPDRAGFPGPFTPRRVTVIQGQQPADDMKGVRMFIRKMRIKNVRVLRDVALELSPVTVLVGANNSGKSSVLDAVINFSNVGRGNFKLPNEGKFSFEALRSQGPSADPFIEYEVEVGDPPGLPLRYLLRYSKDDTSIKVERGVLSQGANTLFDRDDPANCVLTSVTSVSGSETVLAHIRRALRTGAHEDSFAVSAFARSIGSMMTYRLVPYVMAQPAPIPDEEEGFTPRMSGNGYGLAAVLAELHQSTRDADTKAYADMIQRLRGTIGGFDSFEFAQSDADKVEFSVRFDDSRGTVRASQLSDGSLTLIGHIALLCAPSRPHIMCWRNLKVG